MFLTMQIVVVMIINMMFDLFMVFFGVNYIFLLRVMSIYVPIDIMLTIYGMNIIFW